MSPTDAHFDDEADVDASADATEPDAESDAPELDASDSDADEPVVDSAEPAREPDTAETPDAPAGADVDRLQNRLLRLQAEYDNYRRRSVADREDAVRQGRQAVLLPMLDVFDDLRRSLDASRRAAKQDSGSASFDALSQGIDLVFQKFSDTLGKVGVTQIEATGKPFDEDEHEAMMQQASDEADSGTVLAEIQPGYRLDDRVLRHARVIVAE
ncbi:MAG: nucleotide exchange factor GrpE [Bacteroidota bacterium]